MHSGILLSTTPNSLKMINIPNSLMLTATLSGLSYTMQVFAFQPPEKKPNVVIILTDDMGYGDISCYNPKHVKTPNIDKLAKKGVRFTDFYVPTPYCAPSRATLLTGRFPLRHELVQNPAPDAGINDPGIKASEITLGNVFQKAGYKTKLIGKWHLGHKPEYFPVKHGFDEYYGILYSNDMRPVQLIENMDTVEYPIDQQLLTQKYTQKAIHFIQSNKDKPFFLHFCHAMPHKPLAASSRFYTPETPNDLYADVIRELDWSVGEVIKTLKNLKILDNTIVIFMSDNGPWYGGNAGGFKGMKATNWEGGIRVPFIISYPEVLPVNSVVEVPCWSPDIFPTILSLTNISVNLPNKLDGVDITEIIKGKQTAHQPVFSMHNSQIMSVRKGDWKLFVHNPGYFKPVDLSVWRDPRGPDGTTIIAPAEQSNPGHYPGVIPIKTEKDIQLYNLKNDLTEAHDLSETEKEKVNELLQEIKKFESTINLNN